MDIISMYPRKCLIQYNYSEYILYNLDNLADDRLELYFGIKYYIIFYNYKFSHHGIGRIRPVKKCKNSA